MNKKRKILLLSIFITTICLFTAGCSNKLTENEERDEKITTSDEDIIKMPESEETKPKPIQYKGDLELPITGATGFASVPPEVKSAADYNTLTIGSLLAGDSFVITEEVGEWWHIKIDWIDGWVIHQFKRSLLLSFQI